MATPSKKDIRNRKALVGRAQSEAPRSSALVVEKKEVYPWWVGRKRGHCRTGRRKREQIEYVLGFELHFALIRVRSLPRYAARIAPQ